MFFGRFEKCELLQLACEFYLKRDENIILIYVEQYELK